MNDVRGKGKKELDRERWIARNRDRFGQRRRQMEREGKIKDAVKHQKKEKKKGDKERQRRARQKEQKKKKGLRENKKKNEERVCITPKNVV